MLTPEEVKESFVSQGAEDVKVIPLKERLDNIQSFVIATGKSHRQIRKFADSVVIAVSNY